jgi:hypothetical protein
MVGREVVDRKFRSLPSALGQGADLQAVNSDIGQRAVIQRHQLGIGPLSPAPGGKRLTGRNEEIEKRHRIDSGCLRPQRDGEEAPLDCV